jgi:hypothetical protein
MAKVGRKSTSTTWIWIRDAYSAILEIVGSPQDCGPWLVEQIVAERVRCRAKKSTAADDKNFWQSGTPHTASWPIVNFAACTATRDVVPQIDGVLLVRETLSGLAVVREDLEALGVVTTTSPAKSTSPATAIQWPWQENPALIRKEGSPARRVQLECEARLDPTIRFLSTSKKRAALAEKGVNVISDSAIERAFTRKR